MIEWITASKLLPQLIYPFSAILWLLLAAIVFFFLRHRRLLGASLFVMVTIIVIAGSPISTEFYRRHEHQYLPTQVDRLPRVDAVVLLGGDVGLPLIPRLDSEIHGSRALHTLRLYRAGKARMIVVSGGNVFPQNNVQPESFYAASLLAEWGVPPEVILIEGNSRNTYENAKETKKLMNSRQIDKILLVTSAFHMPRALATFKTAGIDAIPSPSSYSIVNYSHPQILEWIPSLGNLGKMQALIREKLGILVYRHRGWIE